MASRVSSKNKEKSPKGKKRVKKRDQTEKQKTGTKKQKTASPGVEPDYLYVQATLSPLHHSDTHALKKYFCHIKTIFAAIDAV